VAILIAQKARFFDGKTAASNHLTLTLQNNNLVGKDPDKQMMLNWDLSLIKIISKDKQDQTIILTNSTYPDSRLILKDNEFLKIKELLSKKVLSSQASDTSIPFVLGLVITAFLFVFISVYTLNILTPVIAKNFPKSWEESLGEYAVNSLIEGSKTCTTNPGDEALLKILSSLKNDDLQASEVSIKVVESQQSNAFAAPNKQVIIYSGLIDEAQSPEELAGVVAHELAHVIKKHSTEAFIRQVGASTMISLMLGSSDITASLGALGFSLIDLSYSREKETEADRIALILLKKNNIDPIGFKDFLERMSHSNEDSIYSYMSTHPQAKDRISLIQSDDKSKEYKMLLSNKEWQDLKNICDNIPPLVD